VRVYGLVGLVDRTPGLGRTGGKPALVTARGVKGRSPAPPVASRSASQSSPRTSSARRMGDLGTPTRLPATEGQLIPSTVLARDGTSPPRRFLVGFPSGAGNLPGEWSLVTFPPILSVRLLWASLSAPSQPPHCRHARPAVTPAPDDSSSRTYAATTTSWRHPLHVGRATALTAPSLPPDLWWFSLRVPTATTGAGRGPSSHPGLASPSALRSPTVACRFGGTPVRLEANPPGASAR